MGYWRVQQVTETKSATTAELVEVQWFRKNAEYERLMADESYDGDLPEEFLDCGPEDEEADVSVLDGRLKLNITDGPEMHAEDNVLVTFQVLGGQSTDEEGDG